jgi:hypothetical protein
MLETPRLRGKFMEIYPGEGDGERVSAFFKWDSVITVKIAMIGAMCSIPPHGWSLYKSLRIP